MSGFLGEIIAFLRVFAFAVAILMLTWSAFQMIIARGKEDLMQKATTRMIYSILGIIFLGFVEGWARWVAAPDGDIGRTLVDVGGPILGIAFMFAAPFAIAFLIYGAYFYITSGGDEERAKKGKTIIINTLLASIILIASMSFITELLGFLS